MQVTELSNAGLKREFKVVVPAATIAQGIAARLAEIAKDAALPGFRPGKVPLPVLQKRFGPAVMGEVLEQTVSNSSSQALQDRGLKPAMQPRVEVTAFGEGADLEYKLAIEVLPEIVPVDLKTLELERVKVQVGDAETGKALERLAEQRGKSKAEPVERAAQKGDIVVIDFTGRVGGKEFAGGAATDHRLELGSNQFVPGFEDQLVGIAPGAKKTVAITFPDAYPNEELKGQAAEFDVTAKQVLAPASIPVDEAMAKDLGFEDLETLRKAVSDQIGREYAELARLRTKRQLLDKLAAAHSFAVPESMVDVELQAIMSNLERERSMGMEDEGTKGKAAEALRDSCPMVVEQTARRARLRHLFALLKERIIFLTGPVTTAGLEPDLRPAAVPRVREPEQGHRLLHQLAGRRGDLGPRDLRHHAVHPLPGVSTVCIGQAASMGSLLLRPARRASASRCRTPHHGPPALGRRPGPGDRHRDPGARDPQAFAKRLNEIYVKHTGQPLEAIEKALERDTFMSAEEPRRSASSTRSSSPGPPRRPEAALPRMPPDAVRLEAG
jgi:trigger factor